MAELRAEIEARFNETIREIRRLNVETAKAEREFTRAAAAGKGFDASMRFVSTSSDDAAESIGRVNARAGKSSAIFFQAGQAVSDFAVAGVLGAANNLELLAFQLGASGPLIAGITALTVSALVFRDEIEEAFAPLSRITKETKEGIEELLEVIGGENRSLLLFESQIPAALEEQKRLVSDLNKEYEELLPKLDLQRALLGDFLIGITGRARIPFLPLSETEEALGRAQGSLEALENQLEAINKEQESFSEGLKNSTLETNRQVEASVRLGIERLGLEKEISQVSESELFAVLERGEIEKFITDLQSKRKKSVREEKTLLERTEDLNGRLKEQLEALRDIDNSRLGTLIQQNAQLREQIRIAQRLSSERARLGGSLGIAGLSPIGAGLQQEGAVTPLDDLLDDIAGRRSQQNRRRLRPRTLDPKLIEEVNESQREQNELISEAEQRIDALASAVSGNLTNAFAGFFEAVGGGGDPFTALRNSIGDFAIDIGRTVIGFAFAGDAIKNFVKNAPGVGIAAGVALVALGSALKRSAEDKASSFASGNASSAPDRPSIIDPRQGRDGRFRRNLDSFDSGFAPQGGLPQIGAFDFTFGIRGEDLVAVTDKNQRRQGRTRGSSPSRALVKNRTSR